MSKSKKIEKESEFIASSVVNSLSEGFVSKLENLIIEGLKRKGFEFESRIEIENFIKKNCECLDNVSLQERVYYVNSIPFLLHHYGVIVDPFIKDRSVISVDATYGSYEYL